MPSVCDSLTRHDPGQYKNTAFREPLSPPHQSLFAWCGTGDDILRGGRVRRRPERRIGTRSGSALRQRLEIARVFTRAKPFA